MYVHAYEYTKITVKNFENMLQCFIGRKREIHFGFGGHFNFSMIKLHQKGFMKYIRNLCVDCWLEIFDY